MEQQELLAPACGPWPNVAIESIRTLYPVRRKKAEEQKRIREALDRIVAGEIDSKPRTQEEAIAYLREKTSDARAKLYGRERRYIPHATTFYHQSRYLRMMTESMPAYVEDAITILQCYPGIAKYSEFTMADVEAHMPAIKLIDEHIRYIQATHGKASTSYLRTRVIRYAECVARWPECDLQYVPGIMKWFKERRYEQQDAHWTRTPQNGFSSERDQLHRIA